MSQTASTCVVPPTAQTPPSDAVDAALRSAPATVTPATLESAPFFRPQEATLVGWIAGLAFGLVCLGAGLVAVVACVVLGLALAVGRLLGRWIRVVQPRVGLVAR